MKKFKHIFFIIACAVLFFGNELCATNIEALGNLVSALKATGTEKKLDLLYKAVEADPDNSQTACQEAWRILNSSGKNSPDVQRFMELWQKHPSSLPVAECGLLLSVRQGIANEIIANQLNKTVLSAAAKRNCDNYKLLSLTEIGISMNLRCQKYKSCQELVDAVYPLLDVSQKIKLLGIALECYKTITFRSELISPNSKYWQLLPDTGWKAEYMKIFTQLRQMEKNLDENNLKEIAFIYYRQKLPEGLILSKNFAVATESRQWIKLWVECATETGTSQQLNEAMKYFEENIEAQRVRRFLNFMRLRNFSAAEKELSGISAPSLKQRLTFHFHAFKPDYSKLRKLTQKTITQGLGSSDLIIPLLIVAEHFKDSAALNQAFALAGKIEDAHTANSLGYVSAVLKENMGNAHRLLKLALKAEPENSAFLDSMAYWHYQNEDYREAQKWMNKALDNAQPHIEIGVMLLHAGKIAVALNQRDMAKKYFTLALKNQDCDSQLNVKEVEQFLEDLKKQ